MCPLPSFSNHQIRPILFHFYPHLPTLTLDHFEANLRHNHFGKLDGLKHKMKTPLFSFHQKGKEIRLSKENWKLYSRVMVYSWCKVLHIADFKQLMAFMKRKFDFFTCNFYITKPVHLNKECYISFTSFSQITWFYSLKCSHNPVL